MKYNDTQTLTWFDVWETYEDYLIDENLITSLSRDQYNLIEVKIGNKFLIYDTEERLKPVIFEAIETAQEIIKREQEFNNIQFDQILEYVKSIDTKYFNVGEIETVEDLKTYLTSANNYLSKEQKENVVDAMKNYIKAYKNINSQFVTHVANRIVLPVQTTQRRKNNDF